MADTVNDLKRADRVAVAEDSTNKFPEATLSEFFEVKPANVIFSITEKLNQAELTRTDSCSVKLPSIRLWCNTAECQNICVYQPNKASIKSEPSVNIVKTTKQRQQTGALLNSGAWRMLGLSSFTSNDPRPSVADAIVFGKRVGAEYLSYEVSSQGIQTVTQVVAHPQYVEGQNARLDLTSNVPGAGSVSTTGTYSTAPHVALNPTMERVRVHRYLHTVYYLKSIVKK
jgi:hypothetical protein